MRPELVSPRHLPDRRVRPNETGGRVTRAAGLPCAGSSPLAGGVRVQVRGDRRGSCRDRPCPRPTSRRGRRAGRRRNAPRPDARRPGLLCRSAWELAGGDAGVEAVKALRAALADESRAVRGRAAVALWRTTKPAVADVLPGLLAARGDADEGVRAAADEVWAEIGTGVRRCSRSSSGRWPPAPTRRHSRRRLMPSASPGWRRSRPSSTGLTRSGRAGPTICREPPGPVTPTSARPTPGSRRRPPRHWPSSAGRRPRP